MKHTAFSLLVIFLILVAPSCRKKGCTDSDADNFDPSAKKDDGSCTFSGPSWYTDIIMGTTTWHQLNDTISESITLTSTENWLLSGGVFVTSGNTITIEAGTTIFAEDGGTTSFLSILQGATINACGSASSPIVFTSINGSPSPGDWGGIVINGSASINAGSTAEGEGGTGTFGGTNDADNSGSLCYVRVEYAGKEIVTGSPMSAISFNGCGYGTALNHLQSYMSSGNGISFLGGTVSMKHSLSSGCGESGFYWNSGWNGNGQFWVCEQDPAGGNFGITGENLEPNNAAMPVSNPTLSNLTLLGSDDGDGTNQGILLANGTNGNIYNCIVTDFPQRGVQIDGDSAISHMTNSSLTFQYSIVDNAYPFKFTAGSGNDTVTVLMSNHPDFNNQIATDGSLVGFLTGFVGIEAGSGFDPLSIGSWFSSAAFIGAVDPSDDWTIGWTKDL